MSHDPFVRGKRGREPLPLGWLHVYEIKLRRSVWRWEERGAKDLEWGHFDLILDSTTANNYLCMQATIGTMIRLARPTASIPACVALTVALMLASLIGTATADAETYSNTINLDEFTPASVHVTSAVIVDPRTGVEEELEVVRAIYHFVSDGDGLSALEASAARGESAEMLCSVIYDAGKPTWNGGPGENEAYGIVRVTNGCAIGASWTHNLMLYETPGGYVVKASDNGYVGPYDDAQTHVSRDCVGNTYADWANGVQGGATQVNDLPCTA